MDLRSNRSWGREGGGRVTHRRRKGNAYDSREISACGGRNRGRGKKKRQRGKLTDHEGEERERIPLEEVE